jgi:hypothetical protein
MATDDFNRADGGLGANWAGEDWYIGGASFDFAIVSNQVKPSGGGEAYAYYVGAFSDDQYAKVTIIDPDNVGDQGIGVVLRMNDSVEADVLSGYDFTGKFDYGVIRRWDNGSRTILANPGWSMDPGDEIGGEAEGTALRIFKNDVEEDDATDGTYSSGNPGLAALDFGGGADSEMDDWEGGDLGAPAAGQPMSLRRRHLGAQFRPGVGGAMLGYERDGFWRHKLLRTVLARELYEGLKGLGSNVRAKFIDALKRSTRAWLTRKPNLRNGWHIRRCREIWQVMEAY